MRRQTDFQPHTILQPRQIAKLLGCTEKHAQTFMASGDLPATKVGRDWVTTYARVVEYLERRIDHERPTQAKPAARPASIKHVQAIVVKPAATRSSKPRLTPEAVAELARQHGITPGATTA